MKYKINLYKIKAKSFHYLSLDIKLYFNKYAVRRAETHLKLYIFLNLY